MIKLESKHDGEKHALLLDHRILINNAYKVGVSDNKTYELKEQLFHFQAKPTQTPQRKKRKRKHNLAETTKVDVLDNVRDYLDLLPKVKKTERERLPELQRHWEDEYTLPQLHGSNLSGKFQKCQISSDKYIIPQDVRFYNHNVEQLTSLLPQLLPSYDLIVIDPPWRNKYIRRLKRAKQELGYAMLDNESLTLLPLGQLTHTRTLVAIWCTNSSQHQQALETQLLPSWGLRQLHKLRWYKLNTDYQLISNLNSTDPTQKQPYELLYLACHVECDSSNVTAVRQTELLLSIPSIVHSHKPPLLHWLRQYLQLSEDQADPHCLELFARYLQPNFTSIGLEVLKLMDERLYNRDLGQQSSAN